MMDVKGKKVLVLGAGKSGIYSATLLAGLGAVVALHDKKSIDDWSDSARSLKSEHGVGLIDGNLPSWLLDQIEMVVISPGVPTGVIPARYVERKDGIVIGEVELAYQNLNNRFIAITGSNGKTTTTSLVGELLKNAGVGVEVGGNIGRALVSMVGEVDENDWIAAELSSFQLETIKEFRPRIAACLNVTPNHMDRYDLFKDYASAKRRIFENQLPEDLAILNADDEVTASWKDGLNATVTMISTRQELAEGLFLRGNELVSRAGDKEKVLTTRENLSLVGLHNVENALFALAIGLACGAEPESMAETLRTFKAVEHRLEFCGTHSGVRYFNDSKATSVDATKKALEAFDDENGQIVLIMGGLGKNAPYEPLAELVRERVRSLILIGEDAENIESQLGGDADVVHASDISKAVEESASVAQKGDVVLLAPACASFDMFGSYEERGLAFKSAFQKLINS